MGWRCIRAMKPPALDVGQKLINHEEDS